MMTKMLGGPCFVPAIARGRRPDELERQDQQYGHQAISAHEVHFTTARQPVAMMEWADTRGVGLAVLDNINISGTVITRGKGGDSEDDDDDDKGDNEQGRDNE